MFLLGMVSFSLMAETVITSVNGKKKMEITHDTVYDNRETYDTIIIGEKGVLMADYPRVKSLLLLEDGGKLVGTEHAWIAFHGGARFINNSGPDAVQGMTLSMYDNNVVIGGEYHVDLEGMYSGYGMRNPYLETTLSLSGRIFNGNINIIHTQGNDLTLGANTYFQSLGPSDDIILVQDGAVIIKKIKAGGKYLIPLSEEDNLWKARVRSDIYLTVNPDAELGPNAAVHIRLITNPDSIPEFAVGEATDAHLYRFVEVKYEDVLVPDFDIELYLGPEGVDVAKGDVEQMRSAFYNYDLSEWAYQDPIEIAADKEKIVFEHVTSEGVLSAGLNLGLDQALCYYPSGIQFDYVGDDSVSLSWHDEATADSIAVQYRSQGQTNWETTYMTANAFSFDGLSPSSDYELRVGAVCSSLSEPAYSSVLSFATSIHGLSYWDDGKVTLKITDDQIVPGYLTYDSLLVMNGAKATLESDVTVQTIIFVRDTAVLDLGRHSLRGTALLAVVDSATLQYNNVYLASESSLEAAFRSTGRIYFSFPPSAKSKSKIRLYGLQSGGDGTLIDESFPNNLGSIIIDVEGRVKNVAREIKPLNDSLVIRNAAAFSARSPFKLEGASFINYVPDLSYEGDLQVGEDTSYLKGLPFSLEGLTSSETFSYLRLETDVEVDELQLAKGDVDYGDHVLQFTELIVADGAFIPAAGRLAYDIRSYDELLLPYRSSQGEILEFAFTPRFAEFSDYSLFYLSYMKEDDIPHDYGVANHYLTRYAEVSHNMTAAEYSLSYDYLDSDVQGDEDKLQGVLYDIGMSAWLEGPLPDAVDTALNKVTIKRLSAPYGMTAGAYVGYEAARAYHFKVSDVTPTRATLTWNTQDADFKDFYLVYKKESDVNWPDPLNSFSSQTSLTGLDEGASYQCFLRPVDSVGYAVLGDSDTLSFTTLTGCEQPRSLKLASEPSDNSLSVQWEDGEAPYTVFYSPKKLNWNEVMDTIVSLTNHEQGNLSSSSYYYVFVESACGRSSDTILVNTRVPGLDVQSNRLLVTDTMEIPVAFTFNSILVDTAGVAIFTENTEIVDSLVVRPGGRVVMSDSEISGFAFVAEDSSFVESGHQHSLTPQEEDKGNVKMLSRFYSPAAHYVYNGTANQYLYRFTEKEMFYNITFDNPDTIIVSGEWGLSLAKGEHFIKRGFVRLNPLNKLVRIYPEAILYNFADPYVLNGGNTMMRIDGGEEEGKVGVLGKGSSKTIVDSLYFHGNGEAIISGDLQVKYKAYTRNVSWYKGFIVKGGRLILEPGAVVELLDPSHAVITNDGGLVDLMLNQESIDEPVSLKMAENMDDPRLVSFVLNSATLGDSAYVSLSFHNAVHPNQSDPTISMNQYLSLRTNVSDIDYDLSFKYKTSDFPSGADLDYFASTLYDVEKQSFSNKKAVNTSESLVEIKGASDAGDLTAVLDSSVVYIDQVSQSGLDMQIYPIPVKDHLTIRAASFEEASSVYLQVIDVLGNVLLNTKQVASNPLTLDMRAFTKGVYFVNVTVDENLRESVKVVKQ